MLGSSFPGSSMVKLGFYYIHRNIGTMVKCSEESVNDPSSYNSTSPLNSSCYACNFISLSYTSYYKFLKSMPKKDNWSTWIHCSCLQMPPPPRPNRKCLFRVYWKCLGMKEKKVNFLDLQYWLKSQFKLPRENVTEILLNVFNFILLTVLL